VIKNKIEQDDIEYSDRKGTWLIRIGILLCVAAVLWTARNRWISWRAGQQSAQILQELEADIPQQDENPDASDEDTSGIPDYSIDPNMEMPILHKGGHDYIGTLKIKALGLKLPIMSEWDYPSLRIAPCRYTGSAYKENMVIAAHNYDTHFGRLKKLKLGDKVTFTDVDGNVFHYEVSDLEVLQPTDIEGMTDSGYALTLFTCTIGGKTRVTVRCTPQ
jgi:sortase A